MKGIRQRRRSRPIPKAFVRLHQRYAYLRTPWAYADEMKRVREWMRKEFRM